MKVFQSTETALNKARHCSLQALITATKSCLIQILYDEVYSCFDFGIISSYYIFLYIVGNAFRNNEQNSYTLIEKSKKITTKNMSRRKYKQRTRKYLLHIQSMLPTTCIYCRHPEPWVNMLNTYFCI